MNLSDFNIKNLGKELLSSKVLSNFINEFMEELKEYLEKGDDRNSMNVVNIRKRRNFI